MGKKGRDPPGLQRSVGSDVIYAERRGQSQKPEEIYQLIEELVPGGARCSTGKCSEWICAGGLVQ